MDPVDQDAVCRTLEAQGRLLGHHDQLSDIWTLNVSMMDLLTPGREKQVPPTAKSSPSAGHRHTTEAPRAHPGAVLGRGRQMCQFCCSAHWYSTSSPSPTPATGAEVMLGTRVPGCLEPSANTDIPITRRTQFCTVPFRFF